MGFACCFSNSKTLKIRKLLTTGKNSVSVNDCCGPYGLVNCTACTHPHLWVVIYKRVRSDFFFTKLKGKTNRLPPLLSMNRRCLYNDLLCCSFPLGGGRDTDSAPCAAGHHTEPLCGLTLSACVFKEPRGGGVFRHNGRQEEASPWCVSVCVCV